MVGSGVADPFLLGTRPDNALSGGIIRKVEGGRVVVVVVVSGLVDHLATSPSQGYYHQSVP